MKWININDRMPGKESGICLIAGRATIVLKHDAEIFPACNCTYTFYFYSFFEAPFLETDTILIKTLFKYNQEFDYADTQLKDGKFLKACRMTEDIFHNLTYDEKSSLVGGPWENLKGNTDIISHWIPINGLKSKQESNPIEEILNKVSNLRNCYCE